jgi:hypothetical protein
LFSSLLWIRGAVDEGLIRRGEFLLSLDFLDNYELSFLNDGKVWRPFKITNGYVIFIAVVRYLFSMPYRQIEGFTRLFIGLFQGFQQ